MNKFSFVFLLKMVLVLTMLTSCSSMDSQTRTELFGEWEYLSSENGNPAFAYDLTFNPDNSLTIGSNSDARFAVVLPGRIKITQAGLSGTFSYNIDQGVLTIQFGERVNRYQKRDSFTTQLTKPSEPTQPQNPASEILSSLFGPKVITPSNADQITQIGRIGNGSLRSIHFLNDSNTLALATTMGVFFYSIPGLKEIRLIDTGAINCVAFSPDGQTFVAGGDFGSLRLWDVRTGEPLAKLEGYKWDVRSVAFSPDGQMLASGGVDSKVRLWDVRTMKSLAMLEGHDDVVESITFFPDGQRLASGGADGTMRLWDVRTGESLAVLEGHEGYINSVVISPDGGTLASGGNDKTVRLWDAQTGESLAVLEGHGAPVYSVAFSPDGQTLASGGGTIPFAFGTRKTVNPWQFWKGMERAF